MRKLTQRRVRLAVEKSFTRRGPYFRFWQAVFVALALIPGALAQHEPGNAALPKETEPSRQANERAVGTTGKNSHQATANLPADTNVISVQYRCPNHTSAPCSITVTKKQFDALVQALEPNMDQASRQSLAAEYSRLLIMAAEAQRRHIDHLPEFQTLLAFSKLQILADRLVREITVDNAPVSEDEVRKYFGDHRREYVEVTLSKIVVPTSPKDGEAGNKAAAERASAFYKRAIAGEDFETLQREASEALASPGSRIGPMRCQLLPEPHRQVCDLEAGQISMPLADGKGYSIYKMELRRTPELSDMRNEIRAMLERQRIETEIHEVRTPLSLQLNERYFGKLPQVPDLAVKHGMHNPLGTTIDSSKPANQHHH